MAADIKEVLRPDNKLAVVLTKICNLAVLNIIWLISCIFLVTIGPAMIALYTVIEKMRSDTEKGIINTYIKAFKQNFKSGMKISVAFWLFFGVLFFDVYLLHKAPGSFNSVMYGGCIGLAAFGVVVFVYLFDLCAIFENTIRGYFTAAVRLVVCNLTVSVLLLIVNLCIPALFLFVPAAASRLAALILIFAGSSVAYISSYLLGGIMEKLKLKS